jgi:hypothetical protein
MGAAEPVPMPDARHLDYLREILRGIRRILAEQYGLRESSVRPIRSAGSRLSMPVRISGLSPEGRPVRYFGKVLGTHDVVSDRSMQFAKNLYLEITELDPIFDFTDTAEDMARQQFESLRAIHDSGVPTARPLGYHRVTEGTWLLVAEFLRARPLPEWKEVPVAHVDTAFRYLKTLHDRGVVHGDIKPENIMRGDRIYILDCGVLRSDAPLAKKRAYDLTCLICSFLRRRTVGAILESARRFFPPSEIAEASGYVDLVYRRQDFHFSSAMRDRVKRAMNLPPVAEPQRPADPRRGRAQALPLRKRAMA